MARELLQRGGVMRTVPATTAGAATVVITMQLDGTLFLRCEGGRQVNGANVAGGLLALQDDLGHACRTITAAQGALDLAVQLGFALYEVVLLATGRTALRDLVHSALLVTAYACLVPLRRPLLRAVLRLTVRWLATRSDVLSSAPPVIAQG